ncbi:hypothetical protein vseg_006377 [Gypsophila vaccaria]
MAVSWMKSLHCKSRAYDDVLLCRSSYQNLHDVVHADPPRPGPRPDKPGPFESKVRRSQSAKRKPAEKCDSGRTGRSVSGPLANGPGPAGATELAEGHPSRNVVEIIFRTRWGPCGFSGRVEAVLKVHVPSSVPARFEEYRSLVKLRAGPGSGARCVADGNEMMRFHCLGPTTSQLSSGLGADAFMKAAAVCTYSGSGVAHERAGGGKGRRAMVVCRVIAGRVSRRAGQVKGEAGVKGEYDSVSGENGELLVYDSRAVLPCFLVVYRLS